MVSEDSADRAGLSSVHRLDDPSDLEETVGREMVPLLHELENRDELLEVLMFGRQKRISLEERDDDLVQIAKPSHHISVHRLAVVVRSPVRVDPPTAEEVSDDLERGNARGALYYHELRLHLPAQRFRVALDRHGEAAFTIDEPDNPSCDSQSFLLIIRTRHVVTIVNVPSDVMMSSAGFSDVPAYGRLHQTESLPLGATKSPIPEWKRTCHLRTVIVTAAVYRGLASRLRPKANLSA